jgi:hypothetical protein
MRGIILATMMLIVCGARAQSGERMSRSDYFEQYHNMAIREMNRSGVPASITLAQGALESGDGNSSLAREARNHFGIKCHEDWNGKKTFQDDDSKNECFRKYGSVEDSYKDHSDYLKAKSRYAFLFDLKITDYKGWARGLKKAGYATNPSYAESLIRIIEEFGLSKYDSMEAMGRPEHRRNRHSRIRSMTRETWETNRVKFIRAAAGDTYGSLGAELGKLDWELPQYNEGTISDSLTPGQVVYIQPKRNKAQGGKNVYAVKPGDTMRGISQMFAIKLERLYALNQIRPGTQPEPGTTLQLRKALRTQPTSVQESREKISGGDEEDEIKVDLNLE